MFKPYCNYSGGYCITPNSVCCDRCSVMRREYTPQQIQEDVDFRVAYSRAYETVKEEFGSVRTPEAIDRLFSLISEYKKEE